MSLFQFDQPARIRVWALKRENPDRTAAQVTRILRASSGWAPSESTLLRLFHRRELMGPAAGGAPVVFGRFEAAAPNGRWVGDALHGPRIGAARPLVFRSFPGAALVRGPRGHAGDVWLADLAA